MQCVNKKKKIFTNPQLHKLDISEEHDMMFVTVFSLKASKIKSKMALARILVGSLDILLLDVTLIFGEMSNR